MTSKIANKFISIVVVSLNTKKKFLKTINSIQKQVYKNYEIIVVDGKSIDGTIEEIKKMRSKKIKYIIEKDKGIYDAMNKGIRVANGEWVIFLNSGDLFYNNCVLKNIYSYKINEYDVVYGDTIVNNKNFKYRVNGKLFNKNSINIPFCHQSSFVKSYLLKKNNFDLRYKICSDFDFFFKVMRKKKIFKKLNLVVSTVEAGGLSDKNRYKAFKENFKIIFKNAPSFKNFIKIIYFLILLLITQFTKFLLPEFIILKILRMKYAKVILK